MTTNLPITATDVRFGTIGHTEAGSAQLGHSAADGSSVNGRVSRLYLLAGAAAVCCYLVVPPFANSTWLFQLVGLSAAAAITVGVRRYRPQPVLPWVLFIVAQVVFVAGDFFYYTFDLAFPSAADGLYIAYYPLQAAGLLLLIRRRNPGTSSRRLHSHRHLTIREEPRATRRRHAHAPHTSRPTTSHYRRSRGRVRHRGRQPRAVTAQPADLVRAPRPHSHRSDRHLIR